MKTVRATSPAEISAAVNEAVTVLTGGGTVIFPTDTLYALGCNGLDAGAVGRLFDIKHRSYTKAVPLLVRDVRWARELAHLDERRERIMASLWPGGVTFVLPRKDIVPAMTAGGGPTIALRAPDHPFAQALLFAMGYPLVGTSANIADDPASQDPHIIARVFAGSGLRPDLLVDGGVLPSVQPSTVVDLSDAMPRILRQGVVRADRILPLL